jgi:outer membrane protein OmpA-like peptidoglycan-associated protein
VKKRKKAPESEQAQPQPEPDQPTQAEQEPAQPEKKKKKRAEERKNQGDQPTQAEQQPPEPTVEQPEPQQESAGIPAEAAEFLADKRIAGDLTDAELKARISTGRTLAKDERIPRRQRQQALEKSKQAAAELRRRQQDQAQTEQPADPGQPKPEEPSAEAGQQQQPKSEAERQQAQELDGNKASPEAEARAEEFLRNKNAAGQLSDEELRQRLESMRALLAENKLSHDSERALRRQLRAEREVLRSRVAAKVEEEERAKREKEQQQAANQEDGQGKQGRERRARRNWDDWDANDVLRDRRRSEDLEEGELRRRIDIYRSAVDDDRYDEDNRRYWREAMGRDRRALRARMIEGRRERADDYRRRRDRGDLDINIDIELDEDKPDSVFAEEADDEELEEMLAAAPRRKLDRRYSVEEIEEDPEIREAMPAIEIDTVRFGFNEAFVREEEVESLDRIAEVIEKILAAHPGEVFMIEGHTDAVGSDAYNLNLSRQRAQAVKEALTTFYVIPDRNLQTVGYGERYLKIPTAEPEQENRRVSLRRVTPLVGEALED